MVHEPPAAGVYSSAAIRRRPAASDPRGVRNPQAAIVNQPLFYLTLAAAAGIGALLRVGCGALAVRATAGGSLWAAPAATLVVNVLGSFLFGAVYALSGPRPGLSPALQAILLLGLLGGFTTYSTFAFQTVEMLAAGRPGSALAYITATNLLAVAAAWAGLKIAAG